MSDAEIFVSSRWIARDYLQKLGRNESKTGRMRERERENIHRDVTFVDRNDDEWISLYIAACVGVREMRTV